MISAVSADKSKLKLVSNSIWLVESELIPTCRIVETGVKSTLLTSVRTVDKSYPAVVVIIGSIPS